MEDDIGYRFWAETKHRRGRISGGPLDWDAKPDTYKAYPGLPRTKLPTPCPGKGMSFEEVLLARHSGRSYSTSPIGLSELSYLLKYSTGLDQEGAGARVPRRALRRCALSHRDLSLRQSSGRLGPRRIPLRHPRSCPGEVPGGRSRRNDGRIGLRPGDGLRFGRDLRLDRVFPRPIWKYGQRSFRYVGLDAGHIAQNLALACASQGLAACHIAAFYDDEVNALLGLDGVDESVIYMTSVGRPR